jgi:hypothetical protein
MSLGMSRLALAILLASLSLVTGCQTTAAQLADEVEGWAVLAEKDDYEHLHMADLPVAYIDIIRMREALERLRWNPDHIHELREFDREGFQAELDWLAASADENDIALLYVTAHGSYLSDVLAWDQFVPDEWAEVPGGRRLVVVDACTAAEFTNDLASDPEPHLAIAAVGDQELSWKGLEEEGLPIIGGVFTFYFTTALNDLDADTDGDGMVSAQEAAQMADEEQRAYMHNVVLVVPEFAEMFHDASVAPEEDPGYPRVSLDDTMGSPFHLDLDAYR